MPIIKFVNESEKIEYSTEQDVCSLLCYAFDANRIFQLSHVLLPSKKTHYCKCNIMCKSAQVPRIIEAVIMLRSIWLLYSSLRTSPHGWLQTLPPA